MLCDVCRNIHFRALEDWAPTRDSLDVFYVHHKSRIALKQSMDLGCHFCAMIWDRLFGLGNSKPGNEIPFPDGEVVFKRATYYSSSYPMKKWNTADWIYIYCDNSHVITTSLSSPPEPPELVVQMLHALTTTPGVDTTSQAERHYVSKIDNNKGESMIPKAFLPTSHPELYYPQLDDSTTSLANMALASFWLKYCLLNHQPCTKIDMRGPLPSRIIDVSQPQQPVLVEGLDRVEDYITLSYKWGECPKFFTTTQNLCEYGEAGISLKSLPRTFRDAICVTHSLGFRWLWIDALCIVQDLKDEVQREMSRMDQIFRNSTLTLFAAAGDHADSGLSFPRDPRLQKPCLLNLKTTIGDKTVAGSVYVDITRTYDPPLPLYERGWVLQEEVLAVRGLIFGSQEMRWRCLCGESTERDPMQACGRRITTIQDLGTPGWSPGEIRYHLEGSDDFNYLRMWLQYPDPLPNHVSYLHDNWFRDNHFDRWYSMVENYSRRALTYESDVLPALAGVAAAMAKTHNCTYLAGLWHEDLQTGLCWYVGRRYGLSRSVGQSSAPKDPEPPRSWIRRILPTGWLWPNQWLNEANISLNQQMNAARSSMPSWSWISRRGERIKFRGWENEDHVIRPMANDLVGVGNVARFPFSKTEKIVEIGNPPLIKTSPQSSTINPYMNITQKTLTLTGRLKTADLREWPRQSVRSQHVFSQLDIHGQWVEKVCDPDTGQDLGYMLFDFDPDGLQINSVFCFLCARAKRFHGWGLTCLGLLPIDHATDRFTRVGLVMLTDPEWFGMIVSDQKFIELLWDNDEAASLQTIHIS